MNINFCSTCTVCRASFGGRGRIIFFFIWNCNTNYFTPETRTHTFCVFNLMRVGGGGGGCQGPPPRPVFLKFYTFSLLNLDDIEKVGSMQRTIIEPPKDICYH